MSLFNRELSWLSFNERVLQEAMDNRVPLVERLRFLGIYSNNLDEFFRVRVATIRRMIDVNKKQVEGFNGSPRFLYETIVEEVLRQQILFENTYAEILQLLGKDNIFHINENEVTKEQKEELYEFFNLKLKHEIVPILLHEGIKFPRLRDSEIYLAVKLQVKNSETNRYALIQIPDEYSRFYGLKKGTKQFFILLDDIIRLHLKFIFSIFDLEEIQAFTFKITRDAELNFDDDLSISFLEKIKTSVKNRKVGQPVRMVYDQRMPEDLLNYLCERLDLKDKTNLIPGGKYHNFKDFMRFPDYGNKKFLNEPQISSPHLDLENKSSLIQSILHKDVLLHFPYQRFDYVVDVIREAAIDPFVKSIKINIYRVAKNSQVMNALLNAVLNGKEVVAVIELQARFDEENNVYWSNKLQEAGVQVYFGIPSFKVHSKLLLIERKEADKNQLITYVGTGNFNESSARYYSDLGLFTSDITIGKEIKSLFLHLENKTIPKSAGQIMLSPVNTRKKIVQLIDNEIGIAKSGKKASIKLKINNLVDRKLIEKLYDASRNGVKIQLNVRGICSLVPGVANLSENIKVISILDRNLEHARFMIFRNNGKPIYFISSADWMERNLDKRIEVGVPILDKRLQKELDFIFKTQWQDSCKARIIDKKQRNKYVKLNETDQGHNSQKIFGVYYQDLFIKGKADLE
jgi:polyphosphate kinase